MANDVADAALMNVRLENGRTVQEELRKLDTLARMLDSQFSVMGMRFGIDSVLGLVPVAGDAIRLKLHPLAIAHIGWNLLFDTVIGAIPLVGDVFDFFFKSNTKNFKVIEKHLTRKAKRHLARGKAPV